MEAKDNIDYTSKVWKHKVTWKILRKLMLNLYLEIHLKRLKKCKNVSKIIVATTDKPEDKVIYDYAIRSGV